VVKVPLQQTSSTSSLINSSRNLSLSPRGVILTSWPPALDVSSPGLAASPSPSSNLPPPSKSSHQPDRHAILLSSPAWPSHHHLTARPMSRIRDGTTRRRNPRPVLHRCFLLCLPGSQLDVAVNIRPPPTGVCSSVGDLESSCNGSISIP
jgi:hypothetical protein